MLEAATHEPRFTIRLKRSTPNLQLSTTTPADYLIYGPKADMRAMSAARPLYPLKADVSQRD
jgi:hypothetical protein